MSFAIPRIEPHQLLTLFPIENVSLGVLLSAFSISTLDSWVKRFVIDCAIRIIILFGIALPVETGDSIISPS